MASSRENTPATSSTSEGDRAAAGEFAPAHPPRSDLHLWMRFDGLERIDVVELDPGCLDEYGRRLATTLGAIPLEDGMWQLPRRGRLPPLSIQLHCCDVRHLPRALAEDADTTILNFSASQILTGPQDIGPLLQALFVHRRNMSTVCLVVHDHAHVGLPHAESGVVCRPLLSVPPEVDLHWDPAEGEPVRLETTIQGASMANGIHEIAFDAVAFCREVQIQLPSIQCTIHRPTTTPGKGKKGPGVVDPFPSTDNHWLLQSLAFIDLKYTSQGEGDKNLHTEPWPT